MCFQLRAKVQHVEQAARKDKATDWSWFIGGTHFMPSLVECHVLTSDWPRNAGVSFHWSWTESFPPLCKVAVWAESSERRGQLLWYFPKKLLKWNERTYPSKDLQPRKEAKKFFFPFLPLLPVELIRSQFWHATHLSEYYVTVFY